MVVLVIQSRFLEDWTIEWAVNYDDLQKVESREDSLDFITCVGFVIYLKNN